MNAKFNVLRSVSHDLAYSLASGISTLTEQYGLNPFEEARRDPNSAIQVDFLSGVSSGSVSVPFSRAIASFRDALPSLCKKHRIPASAFRQLRTTYIDVPMGGRFLVTVEDRTGRLSTDEYSRHGERFRTLDPRGRIRRKRGSVVRLDHAGETC